MEKRTLLGITVLLIGLSPGVLLAADPPLTSVTHDATLQGNGTTSAPLGVVPAARPVLVRDSSQRVIGQSFVDNQTPGGNQGGVLRVVNRQAIMLTVTPNGFVPQMVSNQLLYGSPGCTGTPYSFADMPPMTPSLVSRQLATVGTVYYFSSSAPGTHRMIQSLWTPGSRSPAPGGGQYYFVNQPISFDVAPFVAPFYAGQ